MCAIGLHELITTDDAFQNELYSIAQEHNALMEDHIQFWLQSTNTLLIGQSFTAIMLISPALSLKGILGRFKIPDLVKSVTEFDNDGNVTADWSEAKRRSMRLYVMATQYGSIALFITLAVNFFFVHDTNYGWNCSRDWLPRPDFDTKEFVEFVSFGLVDRDQYSEASEQAGKYLHALFPYLAYILLLKITWNNIALVYRRYRPKEYETESAWSK